MVTSKIVYWRGENKGGILEGTPSGALAKKVSKITLSGNPLSGGSSCNMNSWLGSEQTSWPLIKSTTIPFAKRQEIPKMLRNTTSLPKAKEE